VAYCRNQVDDVKVDPSIRVWSVRVIGQILVGVKEDLALERDGAGTEIGHDELASVPRNRPDVFRGGCEDDRMVRAAHILDIQGERNRID
jgi:hypothetical protein